MFPPDHRRPPFPFTFPFTFTFFALASSLFAEEAPKPADKPSLSIELETSLSAAARSDAVTRVLDRDPDEDSEGFLVPDLRIVATARLPKNVQVAAAIGTRPLSADLFDTDTWGTEANRDLGDGDDADAHLVLAYVRIGELFLRELSLKAGLQDFALSLRGPRDAFFADLRNSEYALVSPVTESVVQGSLYGAAPPEGTDPATAGLFRDTARAGGFRLTWNAFRKSLAFVDVFYFTMLEGGVQHRDERFYGVNIDLLLPITEDAPSLVNLLFAGIQNDDTGTLIWTTGLGIDFRPAKPMGLSIYLEAYWQTGLYAEPADHRIRQDAWAGRIGARLPFASLPFKPALDASFWFLTGDRGDPSDHVNRDFVSYENIDDALVVEDDVFGLDIDSNYFAPKLRLSGETKLLKDGDLRLELFYAYFRLWREPEKAGGATELDPGRRLGHELDLRVSWDVNEQATISIFGGALLDSQWLASKDAYGTGRREAYVGGVELRVAF
ncbi:MAG: hypothetical protein HYY18_09660 [Planctomycetes bacterium]|nr:hypothetical protein [Planctomycetota bacterium]